MSSNIHISARGKQVDMTKLTSQYELTPAVSNVRINARGDELDPHGRIIRKTQESKYDVPGSDTPVQQHRIRTHSDKPNQDVTPPTNIQQPSTALAKIDELQNALKENAPDRPHKGKP